jgi:alpha-D-glucose phosphate-specific phosphoglucomutase
MTEKVIKFGTDGFRGIIAKDFTVEKVEYIAHGISRYLLNKKNLKNKIPRVVIGYDTRFLSDYFARSAAEIFSLNGIETLMSDTFIPTPVLSNAVLAENADLGIMITASHNPCIYNGFKIKGPFGGSATMDIVNEIEDIVNKGLSDGSFKEAINSLKKNTASGGNSYIKTGFLDKYRQQIERIIDLNIIKNIDFGFLIDPMYGAAQGLYRTFFDKYNIGNIFEIHNVINPSFGGINPEPIGDNLNEASEFVLKNNLKVGICVDGDADRIGAIGEKGNFISSHHIFAIVLDDLINNGRKNGRVVKTVTTSSIIDRMAQKNNLDIFITPVGFKYIGEEILKQDVLMGGEESGGLWTNGNIPERDGILMGLKLLEIMVKNGKTLNEILDEIYKQYGYFVYGRNDYETETEKRDNIRNRLDKDIPDIIAKEGVSEVVTIDGYKYILNDGSWLMIRPSGTEAVVRVYSESFSSERLKRLLALGRLIVKGD